MTSSCDHLISYYQDQLLLGRGCGVDTKLEQSKVGQTNLTAAESEREDVGPMAGESAPPGEPTAAVPPAERGTEKREKTTIRRLPWRPPTKPASLISECLSAKE